jgi:hypothetical protein
MSLWRQKAGYMDVSDRTTHELGHRASRVKLGPARLARLAIIIITFALFITAIATVYWLPLWVCMLGSLPASMAAVYEYDLVYGERRAAAAEQDRLARLEREAKDIVDREEALERERARRRAGEGHS